MVPVRLNDRIVLDFVLDTGAADVSIPIDVVSTLLRTGTLTDHDFIGKVQYTLADGSTSSGQRFVLRRVGIGDQTVSNVVASTTTVRGTPLLGQSFLSRLPSGWTIDYRRLALVINGAAAPSLAVALPAVAAPSISYPSPSGAGGFGAFARDDASNRIGLSWNQYNQQYADYVAAQDCGVIGCKIVFRTRSHQCAAVAVATDGNAWGAARRDQAPDPESAALAAVNDCQKRTRGQCAVRAQGCNQ